MTLQIPAGGTGEPTSGSPLPNALAAHGGSTTASLAAAPQVISVFTPAPGRYGVGTAINYFLVNFDQDVILSGGLPELELILDVGGTVRAALVLTNPRSLVFSYTVQAGQADTNGVDVGNLLLNGATLRNAEGVDASISGTARLALGVYVGVPPTVTIAAAGPTLVKGGGSVAFDVTFSESVSGVDAADFVPAFTGSASAGAVSLQGSGAQYVVTVADVAGDGTVRLDLPGGSGIVGAAGLEPAALQGTAAITIDSTAPAAPTLALAVDTGSSGTDGITSAGTVAVGGLEPGASWQYSVDGGDTWTAGTGSSFTLTDDGAAALRVRQTDAAGHTSAPSASLSVTLDTAAPVLQPAAGSPADDAAGVAVGAAITVRFSEPLATLDAARVQLRTADGQVVADAAASLGEAGTLVITPAQALQPASAYHVTWDAGAFADRAGNGVAAQQDPTLLNFTTAAPVAPAPDPAPAPAPPPGIPATVDGVEVVRSTTTQPDGTTQQQVTVPVVTAQRTDSVGHGSLADVPLVSGPDGAALLTAQLPVGVGLLATGPAAPQASAPALQTLAEAIRARTPDGSSDQSALTGGGAGFLDGLPGGTPLLVQTVAPTLGSSGPAPAAPLVLTAGPTAPGSVQTALVIDARGLPAGTALALDHVDFAALIGAVTVTGGAGAQRVWGDSAAQTIFLGEGDDELHGGAGDDVVGSAGGDDLIFGGEGDDLVFGGAGNDTIDGGSGHDTLRLDGRSRADYQLRVRDGQTVFTHRDGGSDGTDTVANVEAILFTGATSTEAAVARLAEGLLGRAPGAAELAAWSAQVSQGGSLQELAASLLGSAEAQGRFDARGPAPYVQQLYQAVLGRAAEAEGYVFWLERMTDGRVDRAGLAVALSQSAERLAADSVTLDFDASDAAGIVRLYATLFGRRADEEGLNHWLAHSEEGLPLAGIAQAMLAAQEAAPVAALEARSFVGRLYEVGLQRTGGADELAGWTHLLETGTLARHDVLLAFAQAPETVALVGSVTTSIETL